MKIFKYLVFFFFALVVIGCNNNKSTISTTAVEVDAEVVKLAAVNINDLTVGVHGNTFDSTSKMYNDLNRTLASFEEITQSVVNTMTEQMRLLNALAQPFKFADSHVNIFAIDNNFTATAPAFVISQTLTKKYFLVSSESKFFLEGKTIRTYFNDATTLSNAWVRVISTADTTKDLYLTIVEIDDSNILVQISNAFIIKKDILSAL